MRKKICIIILIYFFNHCVLAQYNEWTWLKGSNIVGGPQVLGTQGVPNIANTPGAEYEAAEWTDNNGNFWLLTQFGMFFKYDPVTNMWTWIKSGGINWGVQGIPSILNYPGGHGYGALTWTDNNNDLWLYGGVAGGWDSNLWRYNISSGMWTWMKGIGACSCAPIVYGTKGIAAATNLPGPRAENSSSWKDAAGNLWFFGGQGCNGNCGGGGTNSGSSDLWKYDISTNNWTWMSGPNVSGQPAVYGTKGVPSIANTPGGRFLFAGGKQLNGDFMFFGGNNLGSDWNDVWKYNSITDQWTWLAGPNAANQPAVYGTKCVEAPTNLPGSGREVRTRWTDDCGNLWVFGTSPIFAGGINDLWRYSVASGMWTWVSGTNLPNQNGVYGTLGISAPTNIPGPRKGGNAWRTATHFYMFGGAPGGSSHLNDLWRYLPDKPTASFTHSSAACATVNFSNTSTPGCNEIKSSSWNFGDPGSGPSNTSTLTNPTHFYSSAGTFTVKLVVTNCTGSKDSSTSVLSINLPNIAISSPATLTCLVPTLMVTGTSTTSGISYSWSPQGVTTNTAIVTTPGTYSLSVTHTASGCNTTSIVTISQNTVLPNSNISPASALTCLNTSITLVGSSSTSGATFSWSPQGVNTSSASATSPGNYTFSVTDPMNGCINSSILTITQNTTSPNIVINPTGTLTCLITSVNLSASSPSNIIVWNGGTLSNAPNPSSVNTAGTYTTTATDPVNGCSSSSVVTIINNGVLPNIGIAPSGTLTCLNTSVSLLGNSTTNGVTYSWSPQGVNTSTASASNAGNYTLTIYDPISGCSNSSVVSVSQNTTIPITSISVNNPTLTCLLTSALLTGTSSTSGILYQWIGGPASNINTVSLPGNYSLTATDPINSCTNSAVITIIQNSLQPNISVSASGSLNCSASPITLIGNSTTSGASYMWLSGPSSSNYTVSAAGVYSLVVTDPINGCTNFTTITVSGTTSFSANINVLSQINCFGQNNGALQLSLASGSAAPYSITNLNNNNTVSNISSFPVNLNNLSAANYSIQITDVNGCSTILLATISQPAPLNLALSGNNTLCEGESTTIFSNVSGGVAPYSFVWSPTTNNTPNLTLTPNTNMSLTLAVNDNNGCNTIASIYININPKPNATLINNILSGCSPVCASFSLSTPQQPGYTYNWLFTNLQNPNGSAIANVYNPQICFTQPGIYNTGILITTPQSCTITLNYNNLINVFSKPNADFSFLPSNPTALEPLVNFTNLSNGAINYAWFDNSSPLPFSNEMNTNYSFPSAGEFNIVLIAYNGLCIDTAIKTITIEDEFLFYIPNAFTPGGDDINELFRPIMAGYKETNFNFTIFDRWGEQIFYTNDTKSKGWDGTFKNLICKNDVYVWKINVSTKQGKTKIFKGHVSLIK